MVKLALLCVAVLLRGIAVAIPVDPPNVKAVDTTAKAVNLNHTDAEAKAAVFSMLAAEPLGSRMDRTGWTVTCSTANGADPCSNVLDGNADTMWHTAYQGTTPQPPHVITVDMGSSKVVAGLAMRPRSSGVNGFISRHEVHLSPDGTNWGSPVAFGTWYGDGTEKFANFEPQAARYVRLRALTEAGGNDQFASISELNLYSAEARTQNPSTGTWGATLDFPVVPVAGFVDPPTGKVVVWSAWRYDRFVGNNGKGFTLTATWDPATNVISQRAIQNTAHDMFCPGISMGAQGQTVVTGGNDASKTSIWNPATQDWLPAPDMKTPRGYQSSVTLSDGRIFTIGGSWTGGRRDKPGEVYDPDTQQWTALPNAKVIPMLTQDHQGVYRADNHAWLFGWRDGTVFQAGPSTAMNWVNTSGNGSTTSAGNRTNAPDQMCGSAVMFDAVAGKILTLGGAPSYQDRPATTAAHLITIGDPEDEASVESVPKGLAYSRTFQNSVVLPDGSVFVSGGQAYGVPFSDDQARFTPELYVPSLNSFTAQTPNSIPRTYHSMSLLLPDATVFVGGGGLCGGCTTNHFNAQIFTPAYLYNASGQLATRPSIAGVSDTTISIGETLSFQTSGQIASASLVRYGSATHSVNTDQRRVPLAINGSGTSYSAGIPDEAGIMTPGYWMLFVMDAAGVPSVARTILVTL